MGMSLKVMIFGFLTVVLGLVIVIEIYGATTNDYIDAVNSVNSTATCNAATGCFYNASEATNQCRSTADATLGCDGGQHESGLQGLFTGGGVAVLIFMAAALFMTIKTAMQE